jgi:polyphosphate kinase
MLRARLKEILDLMLSDTSHAWELTPDGQWRRRPPAPDKAVIDTQVTLMSKALKASKTVGPAR